MIRIRTPSRLHFGLLALPSPGTTAWLNSEGDPTLPRRQWGGVGLMVEEPGIELTVEPAPAWSAEGPHFERALRFAQTYCAAAGLRQAFHLKIESAAPEHAGLGTGTQLALAVSRAIAELTRQPKRDAVALAAHVGRGLRSALGVHGFEHGGLLVEGGKTSSGSISPLLARHDFPSHWGVLLVLPAGVVGTHGKLEVEAFAGLARSQPDDRLTETLCRLVLLGLLPAMLECDLDGFGEALFDFNRRVGAMFRQAQGGLYAHPRIEEVVLALRSAGIKGVGQSSWGPAVFAVMPAEQVGDVGKWLASKNIAAQEEMIMTRASNRGSSVNSTPRSS